MYGIQDTGLRMAITKSLVDLMGGSITVTSKLDEGSTFTVELELRIQERDDDPKFWKDCGVKRIILIKILSTLGATCDAAGNGQETVDKFEGSRPNDYDLILMDVQMPVMDGYTATRTIRAGEHPSAKAIPIIAMTANAFVDDVREALESGMDAHIAKPVQVDILKSTIQQVLDSRLKQSEGPEKV